MSLVDDIKQWLTPTIMMKKEVSGFSWRLTIWNATGDFKMLLDSDFMNNEFNELASYINTHYEREHEVDDNMWTFKQR